MYNVKYSHIDKGMSRFIFASTTEDSGDKFTRVYVTNDMTLKTYFSGKTKEISFVPYHIKKQTKELIVKSYCSGVDNGIEIGRQQVKREYKEFFG